MMYLNESIDKICNLVENNNDSKEYKYSYEEAFDTIMEELHKREFIIYDMAEFIYKGNKLANMKDSQAVVEYFEKKEEEIEKELEKGGINETKIFTIK